MCSCVVLRRLTSSAPPSARDHSGARGSAIARAIGVRAPAASPGPLAGLAREENSREAIARSDRLTGLPGGLVVFINAQCPVRGVPSACIGPAHAPRKHRRDGQPRRQAHQPAGQSTPQARMIEHAGEAVLPRPRPTPRSGHQGRSARQHQRRSATRASCLMPLACCPRHDIRLSQAETRGEDPIVAGPRRITAGRLARGQARRPAPASLGTPHYRHQHAPVNTLRQDSLRNLRRSLTEPMADLSVKHRPNTGKPYKPPRFLTP